MDDVAGYRVLRAIGRGSRSQVVLGFAEEATVVLKIAPSDDPRVVAEIEGLARAAGEHVVELFDVAADEERTVLVLERLAHGTLADLLERRGRLEAGEAVTLLAPLAGALERMHLAGVAHGALSPTTVGFREDGAPTLLGFGAATLFAPGSPEVVRRADPGVVEDRASLAAVAELVLARVPGARVETERRRASSGDVGSPAEFAERLFALASPVPVRFDVEEDDDPVTVRMGESSDDPAAGKTPSKLPPWILALLPDAFRERAVEYVGLVATVWGRWSAFRRRLVLAGAAGILTIAVAVAVLPSSPDPVAAGPEPSETATFEPVAELPDDPVEAAELLLALRRECLRDLSVLCLDAVVQPGSAAQADDAELVRAVLAGGELVDAGIVDGTPVLVERLGDSALLDLPVGSVPASVLLLRTAEGWRIRQYLRAADPEAPAFEPGVEETPG